MNNYFIRPIRKHLTTKLISRGIFRIRAIFRWEMFGTDVVETFLPEPVCLLHEHQVELIKLGGTNHSCLPSNEPLRTPAQRTLDIVHGDSLGVGKNTNSLSEHIFLHIVIELLILHVQVSLRLEPPVCLDLVHVDGESGFLGHLGCLVVFRLH